jgi:hypothetical protein
MRVSTFFREFLSSFHPLGKYTYLACFSIIIEGTSFKNTQKISGAENKTFIEESYERENSGNDY